MSQKNIKMLRKFGRTMMYDEGQTKRAKELFKRMDREKRHTVIKEMRQFENEQAQSIPEEA